ncbi:hypothetical protein GCM10010387_44240 [Streptomyces inusitatus]|uniref:Clp R domain-containing protein n=1 Tax=Streptomyces inusitatus TaxID=68221 RepID=A0A918UZF8_9ACTN|nr:Clp protease N-terminal domain-containing protein [Streptomyces inusitatus]GGZ44977.1 hypothetical protein GCM10010387_44240 [Streptomyces inusitatus]
MSGDDGESGRMKTVSVGASWGVVGVLGAAWGATGEGDTIGTEHLLVALADAKGETSRALGHSGATVAAQLAVVRERERVAGSWVSTDELADSVSSKELLGDDGDRGRLLSGAASRAFVRAMELAREEGTKKYGPTQLLRALLADESSRAAEVLQILGSGSASASGSGSGLPAGGGLDPLLWPTRDTLLGRRPPRGLPFWKRLLFTFAKGANLASHPVLWVSLDTLEQSRALGQEAGTEHVLLALLATHEVGLRHPHMANEGPVDPAVRHAGGARLAAMGVDYVSVRRAIERDDFELGEEERDFGAFLDAAAGDEGTGPLVEALLRGDTRARRLIESLGFAITSR